MKTKYRKSQTSQKTSFGAFNPLTKKQLQVIVGGSDPVTSRGTKTSSAD